MSRKIIKPSEDEEQAAVVQFCRVAGIPIVHIPNEGKRTPYTAQKLIDMGMSPGFPDLFIPKPRGNYCGLFIEMKVGSNKPTKDQIAWLRLLNDNGYAVCVRYGADAAIKTIERYMGGLS